MKKVSVLINAYNSAGTIAATINSALAQTYPDLEIIIFDNGSGDATPGIVAAYHDPRIHYHRQDPTIVLGEARNAILKLAEGDYLAFLDSDDLWEADKIARQVEQIERTGVGIVFTDATRHYIRDGSEIGHFTFMGHVPHLENLFGDQLRVYTVVNSSVLFRRDALYRQERWIDPRLRVCTDFDLFMRLIYCEGGDFLDQKLTIYNVAAGSTIDSNQDVLADEMSGSINQMLVRWPAIAHDHEEDLQVFYRNIAFQRAKSAWRQGSTKVARSHLQPYLCTPRFFFAYLATLFSFSLVMRSWDLWQQSRRT
ncbi:MAG: glycosyltransferase family 2 protein [Pseudomonadota bacterium]